MAEMPKVAIRAGLIDEYGIVTNPVLVGGGPPFVPASDRRVDLRLVETRPRGTETTPAPPAVWSQARSVA